MSRLFPAAFLASTMLAALPAAADDIAMGFAQPASTDWTGAYAGASIGYGFHGDDRVGFDSYENKQLVETSRNGTKFDVKGGVGGLQLGYRQQSGPLVYGIELAANLGKVKDSYSEIDEDDGDRGEFSSQVDRTISLSLKAGSLVRSDMLVYGVLGFVSAKAKYNVTVVPAGGQAMSVDKSYSPSGYLFGLGAEKRLTERLSVTGEWNYVNLGKTTLRFQDASNAGDYALTRATPSHHRIKVGLNYQF